MAQRTRVLEVQRFHFVCPECGVGDQEAGYLVTFDDVHCMVCHMDDGRTVRLRRWAHDEGTEESPASPPNRRKRH